MKFSPAFYGASGSMRPTGCTRRFSSPATKIAFTVRRLAWYICPEREVRDMTFPEKLITLRAGRGWSQEKLAGELGVTRQAVGRWERGECLPDAMGLTRLAQTFDVNPEWLLDESASGAPEPRQARRAKLAWFDYLAFVTTPLMAGVCLYAKLTFADSLSYLIGAPLLWRLEPILIKPLGWLALGWGAAALLAAFGLRPQSRGVRWALIIAGAVLPAILLLTVTNMYWLHWYRTQHTTWVINSPSMLVIGGLLLGMAAKRRDKMS